MNNKLFNKWALEVTNQQYNGKIGHFMSCIVSLGAKHDC